MLITVHRGSKRLSISLGDYIFISLFHKSMRIWINKFHGDSWKLLDGKYLNNFYYFCQNVSKASSNKGRPVLGLRYVRNSMGSTLTRSKKCHYKLIKWYKVTRCWLKTRLLDRNTMLSDDCIRRLLYVESFHPCINI